MHARGCSITDANSDANARHTDKIGTPVKHPLPGYAKLLLSDDSGCRRGAWLAFAKDDLRARGRAFGARPLALGDPEVRGILGGSGGKLPDDRRAAFEQVCAVVRRAVPDAEEGKSYGLPAFRWKGRPLLGFRAFKDHLSVTPFSAEVVAAVVDRLEGFDLSKGSVRFSPEQPIPEDVLLEMVRLRQAELSGATG